MSSRLDNKIVRPGLLRYSFYASDRHPAARETAKKSKRPPSRAQSAAQPPVQGTRKHHHVFGWIVLLIALALVGFAVDKVTQSMRQNDSSGLPAAVAPKPTVCSSNTLPKKVVVSISKRHMWACSSSHMAYDSPVVTGVEYLAADRTPVGTYTIYAKETNQDLTGCDSLGCWNDPVSYWMPWLSNQYGIYGFHDATWRKPGDFGNIDPNSSNASHGCVELPLSTAKWLYNWAQVGTTVTIEA